MLRVVPAPMSVLPTETVVPNCPVLLMLLALGSVSIHVTDHSAETTPTARFRIINPSVDVWRSMLETPALPWDVPR